jgi:hypothetical protein
MPHVNRLTEATIRNAIRRHKPYQLSDGMGLGLIVNPDGSKWWRFRYRDGLKPTIFKGKNREQEKALSFGVYPEVRLAEARERRDDCRALESPDLRGHENNPQGTGTQQRLAATDPSARFE